MFGLNCLNSLVCEDKHFQNTTLIYIYVYIYIYIALLNTKGGIKWCRCSNALKIHGLWSTSCKGFYFSPTTLSSESDGASLSLMCILNNNIPFSALIVIVSLVRSGQFVMKNVPSLNCKLYFKVCGVLVLLDRQWSLHSFDKVEYWFIIQFSPPSQKQPRHIL